MFFKHFALKNQLPAFYIRWTLVENGLILEILNKASIFMCSFRLFFRGGKLCSKISHQSSWVELFKHKNVEWKFPPSSFLNLFSPQRERERDREKNTERERYIRSLKLLFNNFCTTFVNYVYMVLMLYSFNRSKFTAWLTLFLNILSRMCIANICFPGCDQKAWTKI